MTDPIVLPRESALLICYALQAGVSHLALLTDLDGFIPNTPGIVTRQKAMEFIDELHGRILKSCLSDSADECITVQTVTAGSSTHSQE